MIKNKPSFIWWFIFFYLSLPRTNKINTMTKELVTIEFRYRDKPKGDWDSSHTSKTITIGIYDTLDEAIIEGNKVLELLESKFELHTFPDGRKAKKERFGKNNGCLGYPNKLVTDMAYLRTPFNFFAKIEQLKYNDVEETITEVLEAGKRYKEYEINLEKSE